MKRSLKVKLILMFFIFIAIPIAVLGSISYIMAANSMQRITEQQLRELTTQTSEAINETIASSNEYIKLLSHDGDLIKAASGDDTLYPQVFKYLSKVQKDNSDTIESLVITDISARGIVSNESRNNSINFSDREYVKKALKGSASQSDIIKSKATNKPVVAIAHPLILDNKVVGTIIGTIKFESISKHADKVKVGKNGYAYIIDNTGLCIYHPNSENIMKLNLEDIGNAELNILAEKMKAGETDEGYYTYEGIYKFVRFMPVNNWTVVVTANYNEYMAAALGIRNTTILIAILSVVISMILVYFVATKNIINPIKALENLMIKAGKGDLTVRSNIKTKDEIQVLGEYFNTMLENQSNIIGNVRDGSNRLASVSEETAASTEEINASTEQIASNTNAVASNADNQNNLVVETSKVLVELSSLIQIAQNRANTAKDNSANTMDAAKKGRENVNRTVQAIENINKASSETENILRILNELSNRVSGIINTINNISDQTNLLALNAAVEAARAGDHGKGFTVVADEVRKLSEQTSVESNEISSLIKEMVIQINRAVESMSFSKEAVENGVSVVNETDKSFVSIISAVQQIEDDIKRIVNVTKDEVASSDQIVQLIDSVATITETTAVSSHEVAAATQEQSSVIENLAATSEETSAMADRLNNLVENFKI